MGEVLESRRVELLISQEAMEKARALSAGIAFTVNMSIRLVEFI